MGRKRTAEEYFQAAEANGWVAGAHEQEDHVIREEEEPTERYKMNQQEALDQWTIFMSAQGVSAADCLREGCPLPTNVLLKDFARWYCKSRRGRLSEGPNDTSVRNTVKKFFSGFQRVTKTKIPDQLRADVYMFVRTTLIKEGYCTTKKREKHLFDGEDLDNCITSLWTDPDVVFMHEEMRSQITLLTQAYLFSGARLGAFLHDFTGEVRAGDGRMEEVVFKGLTWRDVHIFLLPLPDGTTERIIKLTQRWVKGNKDPENHISEVTMYEDPLLKFDLTAFVLRAAFRDSVLPGFSSPAQLWDQRVPEGESMIELRKDPHKLDVPVLRTVTRHGGISDRMLDASTFRYYFKQMTRNAGYYGVVTIHALRRGLANAVDKIATAGERNKLLGWASSDVCNKRYLSDIAGIDGMGAILKGEQRTDHIKKLRSASTKRAPGLPQELPAERMAEFTRDPKACSLLQNIHELRQGGASQKTIQEAESKYNTYRHLLKNRLLEQYKADWLEVRYENILETRGQISQDRSAAISRAETLFRIMPERARLAKMIKSTEPRTREQKLQCVQDLLSLTARSFEVMYRPGEEPVDGACPVCRSTLPKLKQGRADHIHACRRKEFIAEVSAGKASGGSGLVQVEYCFLCFTWVDGDTAWEEHCRGHLDTFKTTWCAIRVYCHTMVSPGFCPWCLVNEGLLAADRLKQWTRNGALMAHVEEKHVEKIRLWPASCGCGTEEKDAMSLRYHLSDVHGLQKTEWRRFGVNRHADGDDNPVDATSVSSRELGDGSRPRRRRRLADGEVQFLECSPVSNSGSGHIPTIPGPAPPHRTKPGKGKKTGRRATTAEWTFVEWSPSSTPDPSHLSNGRQRGARNATPLLPIPPSPCFYPDPEQASLGTTSAGHDDDGGDGDDDDERFDGRARPAQSFRGSNRSSGSGPGALMHDAIWLDDDSGTARGTIGPTSTSPAVTDICFDVSLNCLDPALFGSESPISDPPLSECSEAGEVRWEVGAKERSGPAEGLQGTAATAPPNAQAELASTSGPIADHSYSTRSGVIDLGTESPERSPSPPPEQGGEPPWWCDERGDTAGSDGDSVKSFDSLPSLSTLINTSSSQTTALAARNRCQHGASAKFSEVVGHDFNDERRMKLAVWTPTFKSVPEDERKPGLYNAAADKVGQRSMSSRRCIKCGGACSGQTAADHPGKCGDCRGAEVTSMKKEWDRRSYPTIRWATFPDRLRASVPFLLDVLSGRFQTPFLQRYKDQMRNLMDYGTDMTRSGYYGPRGETLVSEFILFELREPLRRARQEGSMVGGSIPDYVLFVLTPTMVLRLIMDDMSLDMIAAHQVMMDSARMGMFFYDDD